MTVNELIANLRSYAKASPENGSAEIILKYDGAVCLEFGRADDLRGMYGEHYLALCPNESGRKFYAKEFKKQ